MIKEEGTVKIGVYLSRESWNLIVDALLHAGGLPGFGEEIADQLASPSSWISGAKEQG